MIENVTYTCGYTIPYTYQDGILLGILIGMFIILALTMTIVWAEKRVVKESIYHPESFKIRQEKFKEDIGK